MQIVNAQGSDPVAVAGLLLSLVIAACGAVVFLFKTFRTRDEPVPVPAPAPTGETEHVADLRNRIEDLERELESERRGREEDNRRHRGEMRDLERRMGEMQTNLAVNQAQLMEAYRRLGDRQQGGNT